MKKLYLIIAPVLIGTLLTSCNIVKDIDNATSALSESEIYDAQREWGLGLVHIGDAYLYGGDYAETAREHIERMYGFGEFDVKFNPMVPAGTPRADLENVLSYYIGGDNATSADVGFALMPWKSVRFENFDLNIDGNTAVATGKYRLTTQFGEEFTSLYKIEYARTPAGAIKITHHEAAHPTI